MYNKRIYLLLLLIFALAILFAGCQSQSDPIVNPPEDTDIAAGVLPPTIDIEHPEPETNPSKGNAHISSPSDETTDNEEAGPADLSEEPDAQSTDNEGQEAKVETEVPYNPTNPTLMGFTINQSKDEFTTKFGMPRDEFLMPDDRDPITVYLYEGFSAGFNNRNQIAFIDVHISTVDPGLNGFRLGQSTDEAIRALGKPDTNTEFVLNYISDKVILKMDVDPNANQVISIKLFAR